MAFPNDEITASALGILADQSARAVRELLAAADAMKKVRDRADAAQSRALTGDDMSLIKREALKAARAQFTARTQGDAAHRQVLRLVEHREAASTS